MSTEKVTTRNQGPALSSDELSKLTEFFSLLIEIDRKNIIRKEVKQNVNTGRNDLLQQTTHDGAQKIFRKNI